MEFHGLRFTRWTGLLFYPLFPLLASTLSSETPLYLALCLGAFASYRRQHYRLAALCASLAALSRPDALLVAVILGVHYIWSHPPIRLQWRKWFASLPWQAMLIYLGIGLCWVIYAWATYGSPIPLTLFAKRQQAYTAGSQTFLPGLLTIAGWYSSWLYQLQALLALPGLVFGLQRVPAMRWLAAWTALYFIAYSLLGVTRYFWYYAPLVALFVLAFGAGLDGLDMLLRRLLSGGATTQVILTMRKTMTDLLTGLVLGGLALFLLVVQFGKLWNMHLSPDQRIPIYHAIGEWLSANSPSEATVGTLEVGIIGYYAQRPMVDFSGLIQPEVAINIGESGSYAAAAYWAIAQYAPNYLVLRAGEFPDVEAKYLPECQLQATFLGEAYHFNSEMSVYACP
jgi:hypothetical protein